MTHIDAKLQKILTDFFHGGRKLTVLTGAGLSEASGVPTYIDSQDFRRQGPITFLPREIPNTFKEKPLDAWAWYLHLRRPILTARPTISHIAVRDLETLFEDRFRLVTQNIDNLHARAGSSRDRTCEIHDSHASVYCSQRCTNALYLPPAISFEKGQTFTPEQIAMLKCPMCGNYLYPPVFWSDEYYSEQHFTFNTALRGAKETGLLLVAGVYRYSGLPEYILANVLQRSGVVISMNPCDKWLSDRLSGKKNACVLPGDATEVLPELVSFFQDLHDTTPP